MNAQDAVDGIASGRRPGETGAHRVLHLLPSAPHELVVEVYWHLVHRLRIAGDSDPAAGAALDRLNQAYAELMGRAEPAQSDQHDREPAGAPRRTRRPAEEGRRRALPGRTFRNAAAVQAGRQRSPAGP